VSQRVHIAAAAQELNRKLFSDTQLEGSVIAENDNLEVTVLGSWDRHMISIYNGYGVSWREIKKVG
jgi:hypothetical protein